MNKKYSILILSLMAFVIIAASISYYIKSNNQESKVYLDWLKYYKHTLNEAALFSGPTNCGNLSYINESEFPQELIKQFESSNSMGSKPIGLEALEGYFNIVNSEDTNLIHKNKAQLLRYSNKYLVRLSRVGFNKQKTEALFCEEHQKRGYLIYLVKENNTWKVSKKRKAWGH